jgi:hypothetical protein
MLEELLRYDKLGNKEELLFVLFDALPISINQKKEDLKRFCISNVFSISTSFNGIIKLLEFISFIEVKNDTIVLNKNLFDPASFINKETYFIESNFIKCFFDSLHLENSVDLFLNADALKYNSDKDKYYIKDNLIPYKYISLRNLLLNIGFIRWDIELNSNHLVVNQYHNETFKIVINWLIDIKSKSKYKRSIDQLKEDLRKKEELGKAAELFVLKFECDRLAKHPYNTAIKRISDEFVNAGYDLESFNDIEAITLNRFIEVKSYNGEISFFWTKNEVQVAKELADKYFLYLVDRQHIDDDNYKPKIFQNPYEKIFENEYWKKETDCWKISIE